MKTLIRTITLSLILCLALVLTVAPTIFAKDGEDDNQSTTTSRDRGRERTDRTNDSDENDTENESENETESEDENDTENDNETTSHQRGRGSDSKDAESSDDNESDSSNKSNRSGLNFKIRHEIARVRLDEKKKLICEARQDRINHIVANVNERSQNQFNRIGQIYTITGEFYTKQNLVVDNYDALVATVTSTRSAAETALQKLEAAPKLSCDSDGPKADIQAYLNLRLDKVSTFKAYRDAVKAFVKAVKEAAESNDDSSTEGVN